MVRATVSSLVADDRLSDLVRRTLASLVSELDDLRQINVRQADRLRAVDDELRLAAGVQRELLPAALPEVRGARIAALYRPADSVGGDLYDVFRIDGSHVALWVADATGHGVSAGLISAFVKGAFRRSLVSSMLDPGAALTAVNAELLAAGFSECQFVTAVYAVYHEGTQVVDLARAGAPYPLHVSVGGRTKPICTHGPMLGVAAASAADFQTTRCELAAREALIVHTDGIELEPRLTGACNESAGFDVDQFLNSLDDRAMPSSAAACDDVTVLALQSV